MPTLSERIRNVVEHTSAFQWLTEWADEAARLEGNQVPEGFAVVGCTRCQKRENVFQDPLPGKRCCRLCSGSGKWGDRPCPMCKQTGRIDCEWCAGTGKHLVKTVGLEVEADVNAK